MRSPLRKASSAEAALILCVCFIGTAPAEAPRGVRVEIDSARVAFSPGPDGLSAILSELKKARTSIDMAMFFLPHEELVAELGYLSERRGVKIRLFTDEAMEEPSRKPLLERLAANGVEVRVEYVDDGEYLPILVDVIKSAHQSILIDMYHLPWRKTRQEAQEEVLDELRKAARRGVYVYMVLDMPANRDDEIYQSHTKFAERLRGEGMDVRLAVPGISMHEKMVIVDGQKVILGSSNLTLSGVRWNNEMNVEIASPGFVRQAVADFLEMKKKARPAEALKY